MSAERKTGSYRELVARYGGDIGEVARAGFDKVGRGVVVMDLRGKEPRGRYIEAARYLEAIRKDSGVEVERAEAAVIETYDPHKEAVVAVLTPDGHHGGAYLCRFPPETAATA